MEREHDAWEMCRLLGPIRGVNRMQEGPFPFETFILRIRTDIALRYSDDDQTDFLDVQAGTAIQVCVNCIAAMLTISAQCRGAACHAKEQT